MRTSRPLPGVALLALLATGCLGGNNPAHQDPAPADLPVPSPTPTAEPSAVSAIFMPPDQGGGATTYDEEAVPEGATADVRITEGADDLTVRLSVTGLEPEREFGAHVHTDPCGPEPGDSGPHYQDEVDPEAGEDDPSTDPEYANPENEIWLDFTTDAGGNAVAESTVDWTPREGEANSIVIHEEHTHTEEGRAGQAGDRLACVNVQF